MPVIKVACNQFLFCLAVPEKAQEPLVNIVNPSPHWRILIMKKNCQLTTSAEL